MKDKVLEQRLAREVQNAYIAGYAEIAEVDPSAKVIEAAARRAKSAVRRIRVFAKQRNLDGPMPGTRGTCPEHGCEDREPVWYMPTKNSQYHPVCASYTAGSKRVCFKKLTDIYVKKGDD